MTRRVAMLLEHCLQTYMSVFIPHFCKGPFIWMCLHLSNRQLPYKSGSKVCKLKTNDGKMNIDKQVFLLTPEQLKSAAMCRTQNLQSNSPMDAILQKIVTSCKPIGHSNAAAKQARRNFFAMSYHFGLGSFFFTILLCNLCSFCVWLFAQPGCAVALPSRFSPSERHQVEQPPGACALEFDDIMKVLMYCLIGWDSKKKQGRKSIFGVVETFRVPVQEQARYTSYAHMILWIKNFTKLRALLFHANRTVRETAKENT